MEFVRRNSDYALRSLAYMARLPKGERLTINIIAKKQNVPLGFLRKTFQKLTQAQILGSRRGPRGGFYLLKKPSEISLKEILESVQGEIALSDCLLENNLCNRSRSCKIKKKLFQIHKEFTDTLDRATLEEVS